MATIKSTKMDTTPDGRQLVKVIFTPHGPNPAQEPDVEVVFEVKQFDTVRIAGRDRLSVSLRSATRTDTREPYTLSDPQRDATEEAAVEAASDDEWPL